MPDTPLQLFARQYRLSPVPHHSKWSDFQAPPLSFLPTRSCVLLNYYMGYILIEIYYSPSNIPNIYIFIQARIYRVHSSGQVEAITVKIKQEPFSTKMETSQMSQFNFKDKLLMKQESDPIDHNPYSLHYQSVQTEGECVLNSVVPVALNNIRYNIFCVISVLLLGLPVLLVYWYPKCKLWIYYDQCQHQGCTHFAIINYDDQLTIVQRQEENYTLPDPIKEGSKSQNVPEYDRTGEQKIVYFINRYMKYRVIDTSDGTIVKADIYDYETAIKQIITQNYIRKNPLIGRSQEEVRQLRRRFGPGVMIIEKPGLLVLFFREIVRPMYLFILSALLVWIYEHYIYYCGVIFFTSAIGIIVNLHQTYTLNEKIYQMAYYETDVNVLREDKVVKISSKDVVPSDIVFLKNPLSIPFDGVILQGSALINESALTGESVPVVRKAQPLQSLATQLDSKLQMKSNMICEGTTLIQVDTKHKMQIFQKYRTEYGIPVYVVRTNFVTLKGQLIRIISFPIQKTSVFERQSSWFLVFLFFVSIISYTVLIFKLKGLVDTHDMIVKFLDLITVTVPPGLPVSMTFGIIHAVQKLKSKNIFCISPNKVIMGGLVDFICFDKTGTLTEDFMDFKCVVPSRQGQFRQVIENPSCNISQVKPSLSKILQQNQDIEHILTNMAANHTITNIISTGENVGDPMQVKLFQFGEYKFDDEIVQKKGLLEKGDQLLFGFQRNNGHYGVVIRRMEFDSDLLRMSVVAKSSVKQGSNEYFLYTKGSPEALARVMSSSSLPKDYFDVLNSYASDGFRVLAIGHKKLRKDQILLERIEIQADIEFDGFEVFENRLKPETKSAILELKEAKIPCVMITGDNALTGCNIANKCKIANPKKKQFIFNYKAEQQKVTCEEFKYWSDSYQMDSKQQQKESEEDDQKDSQLQFEMKEVKKSPKSSKSIGASKQQNVEESTIDQIMSKIRIEKAEICLTGSAFSLLFSQIKLDEMDNQRKTILKATKVYARAKPNEKARIIMSYQQGLEKVVSMCGDGANDCGALKQSDAGLSLSQTQASISAPFTSKVTNVGSMVELIKQCRAGLVTNFSLFNIMTMYSLIQYASSVLCQYFFSYPGDFAILYWDLFGNFFFFMVFGYTGTADKLSQQRPSRSLLTLTNMIQVWSMHIIQFAGQVLMLYSLANIFADEIGYWEIGGEAKNYQAYVNNDNTFVLNTPESSILFFFCNFMYIFSFIGFSISKPWRKQFYTNIPFMVILVIVFICSSVLVVVPESRLTIMQLQGTNKMVNLFTLLAGWAFGIIMYVNQKCIMEPISAKLRKRYPNKVWI